MSVDQAVHASSYLDVRRQYGMHLPDTTDSGIQDAVVRCLMPTGELGWETRTGTHAYLDWLFPGTVTKWTPQRLEYARAFDDDTRAFGFGVCHREFGKTTIATGGAACRLTLRRTRHLIYTSGIYDVAAKRTETIRAMLVSSEIEQTFGKISAERGKIPGATFSEAAFTLVDPKTLKPFAVVNPRGAEQVVNGAIAYVDGGIYRPDFILSDDGQKRKDIGNEDVRRAHEEWFEGELLNTVDVEYEPLRDGSWNKRGVGYFRAPWRVWVQDTPKHKLANIVRLMTAPEWKGLVFKACELVDGVLVSCSPLWTDNAIQRKYERMCRQPGGANRFAREFMCMASLPQENAWRESMHRHYTDLGNDRYKLSGDDTVRTWRDATKFIVVDPARTVGPSSAYTSILAVAVDIKSGVYFRRNIVERLHPEDQHRRTFELARELGTRLIFVEESGGDEALRNEWRQAASRLGYYGDVKLDWLRSKRSADEEYGAGREAIKKARAYRPYPLYERGQIFHEESMRGGALERAQLAWPDCSHWDATDTSGYVMEIMGKYELVLDRPEGIDEQHIDDGEGYDETAWDEFIRQGAFFR